MDRDSLSIYRDSIEPFFKNGYLLVCSQTLETSYIDPGDEVSRLLEKISELDLRLVSILNTHAHLDHICGVREVKQRWQVPVYLHQDDEFLYDTLTEQARWFGLDLEPAPPLDGYLRPGSDLSVGNLTVKVHHTPGHSPGGVCLEVDRHVFCGDAIFAGSIGRTDLPGGCYETLMKSIREVILPLGDEKVLHPGHGPDSTIGRERKTNPFILGSAGN